MSSIVIRRKEEYANRSRDIEVYIDGVRAGTISNGEIIEFHLDPGTHKVKASIDWCGSREVTVHIRENEVKDMQLYGFKSSTWFINLALLLMAIELVFHKRSILPYLVVFSMVPCIILMYYITIGRKEYLNLELTN